MPRKKNQIETSNPVRNLSATETKALLDSNSKINTNQKEVAIQASKSLDSNSDRYYQALTSELESINEQLKIEHDPERIEELEVQKKEVLAKLHDLYEQSRQDQKEIHAEQKVSSENTILMNLNIAVLIAGGTGILAKYGKPAFKWISREVPKLLTKK